VIAEAHARSVRFIEVNQQAKRENTWFQNQGQHDPASIADRQLKVQAMNPTSQASSLEAQDAPISRTLAVLDPIQKYTFIKPVKRINEGQDVPAFLSSKAYSDIGTFIMQLNIAMCPRKNDLGQIKTLALDSDIAMPEPVRKLQEMLKRIDAIIEEAPPDTGPRRFGNVSFRKWYELLEDRARTMLEDCLPRAVLDFKSTESGDVQVLDELIPYFMGGFGSPQRLDYGTGHELSFLAFLGCIWKLGGFTDFSSKGRDVERSLVVGVIEPWVFLGNVISVLTNV
jgi:serine/threonine-protein phosphatase 2A activator